MLGPNPTDNTTGADSRRTSAFSYFSAWFGSSSSSSSSLLSTTSDSGELFNPDIDNVKRSSYKHAIPSPAFELPPSRTAAVDRKRGRLNNPGKQHALRWLEQRERGSRSAPLSRMYTTRLLPSTLMPYDVPMPGYDKVFAAEWLDDRQVLVGTKCGQLVVIDSATGRRVDVPLANDIYGESSMALCNAGRSPSIEFENRLSASRPSVSSDRHQAQEPLSDPDPPSVRSICMSPCGNLLAVSRGSEIQILSLPELSPIGLLHAHTDVIFSLDWISDTILVSGGRDGSVRFWDTAAISSSPSLSSSSLALSPTLFPDSSLPTLAPLPNTITHSHRVRALTYSPQTSTLLTLTTTSKVKLYSLSAARPLPLFSHTLPRTRDPTCSVFSSTQNTFIVGSADRLHFIDPRAPDLTHVVRAFDDDNGVRSLATTGSVVAVGSGGGFVSFYDLRAGKYIEWEENGYVSTLRTPPKSAYNAPSFSPLHPAVTMSTESLAADVPTHLEEGYTTYLPAPPATPHFDATHDTVFESPTAIYALGFSRCGGRLVAAGGPLHVNVGGCMGGVRIWA